MTYFEVVLVLGLVALIIGGHVVAIAYADDYVYSRKYAKDLLVRTCVLAYIWTSIAVFTNTSWDAQVTTLVHGIVFVTGAAAVGFGFVTFGLGFVLLICITVQTYGELCLFVYDSVFTKKGCV